MPQLISFLPVLTIVICAGLQRQHQAQCRQQPLKHKSTVSGNLSYCSVLHDGPSLWLLSTQALKAPGPSLCTSGGCILSSTLPWPC